MSETVCVTGGSGCIGSWLVRLLLDRGYTVRATVQDLKNEKETKHLEALEGADSRLRLFRMNLLDYESIAAAVTGCAGVFHLASPCTIDQVQDPEKELIQPAVEGTMNVLTAAKKLGVRRVVVTSSSCAIMPSPNWPADAVMREDCWTDVEYCKQKGVSLINLICISTFAEFDVCLIVADGLVVVSSFENIGRESSLGDRQGERSGCCCGESWHGVGPSLNSSMIVLQNLLQGWTETLEDLYMGCVHFKDVAMTHILVYENLSANGRHLCVESILHYGDFVAKVAELYPECKVPRMPRDTQPGLLRANDGSKKLMDLGLQFIPMEQIIKEAVECLKSKGSIS